MVDGTWESNPLKDQGGNWVRQADGSWVWEDPDWSPSPGERAAADQAAAAALEALRRL